MPISFYTPRSDLNSSIIIKDGQGLIETGNSTGPLRHTLGNSNAYFYKKTNWVVAQSAFTNPVMSLVTFTDGNQNNSCVIKVRAIQIEYHGAAAAAGNETIGMASIWRSSTTYSTYTTAMSVTTRTGTANLGTLGWTNQTLTYTTNRATNYDSYYVEVEVWQTSGGNYTITMN